VGSDTAGVQDVSSDTGTSSDVSLTPVGAPRRRRIADLTPWVSLVARLALGGVLAAAGLLKLATSPTEQVRAVRAYQLLPVGVDAAVGYTLPFLELALALALILGVGARLAAVASGVLLLAFIVGIASVWARGISIDCGCFGGGGPVAPEETNYLGEILRDLGLVVAAAWVAVTGPGRFALLPGGKEAGEEGE